MNFYHRPIKKLKQKASAFRNWVTSYDGRVVYGKMRRQMFVSAFGSNNEAALTSSALKKNLKDSH